MNTGPAELPTVSVVIPTAGRNSVVEAATSALQQTTRPLEVIVVIDGADEGWARSLEATLPEVTTIMTGGIGANSARMRGVAAARGESIAFLDDDDTWLPEKLELQLMGLTQLETEARHLVMSCRVAVTIPSGPNDVRVMPRSLLRPHESVAAYLFRRTSPRYGEALLHTSTLLFPRDLVLEEPWSESLTRHQDWDWVLRVGARSDVAFAMCPEVLVRVAGAAERSISLSPDWRASVAWLEDRKGLLSSRERGDFILCHTAPIATRSGDRRAAFALGLRAARTARPGFPAWIVWAVHLLVPAKHLDHLSARIGRLIQRAFPTA